MPCDYVYVNGECCGYVYSWEEEEMAECNALKPRKCDFCFESFITDAKGIKIHAVACEKELEEKTTPDEIGA